MPEAVRPVRPVRLCCVRCGNDPTNHDLFLTIHDLTDHALRLPIHDLTNHDLSLTIHDLSTRVWRLTLHDLTNHDLAIHVQPSPLPRLYWAKLRRQSAAASAASCVCCFVPFGRPPFRVHLEFAGHIPPQEASGCPGRFLLSGWCF